MKTSTKSLFMSTLIMSTIFVMNSTSWMSMWMGMEMNLMSFIPLVSSTKNKFTSQSVMMYFLIQSMASMLFLIPILIYKYLSKEMDMLTMLIIISMMMKMGMAPFHNWFVEISNKMKWNMLFILMTWQKMAPMYVMSVITMLNSKIITLICLSSLVGAMGGMNQTSTTKMMAYSSINHLSWMMICATTFKKSWILYLTLYSIMMLITTNIFMLYNVKFINQMNIFLKSNLEKISMTILMLSLGGLPPFIGFMPKWIAIQNMIESKEFMMMIIMTTSSLISLSYYLRLTSSMNLLMNNSQKWMTIMKTKKTTNIMIIIMNMSLPMLMFMMNLS